MSMLDDERSDAPVGGAPQPPAVATTSSATGTPSVAARLAHALSFRNISAVYILIALIAIFSLWVPETFLTPGTWRTLLDNQAITAIVAVGLTVPIAAGCFDLAVGAEVGFGAIVVAYLLAEAGLPVVPAVLLALAVGALIGVVSGLLVVKARIDSFIATLGMSSVLTALTAWVSDSQQILDLGVGFQELATGQLFGITYPVYVLVVLALLVWYVMDRTPAGRRVYATGGNPDAARLAGVPTSRVIVLSLVTSAALAAVAGILLTSQLATGDPTVGGSYLLPAFAAVFLGSTQFRGGRYNIAGTVLAVYVLAVGVKGLQLAGAPVWLPNLFNGLALLIAVGLTKYEWGAAVARSLRRRPRTAPRDGARA
ncbi:ABC transporter permease [Blastococcus sp. SYSU D00820]